MGRPELLEAGGARTLRCPLCQRTFGEEEMSCHHGCPLAAGCRVLCCPHCGYEFVDTAPTERRLARLRGWWGRLWPWGNRESGRA